MEFKKGVDILSAVGGIATIDAARKLFTERLDSEHLQRLNAIHNEEALLKVANAIAMCSPDTVFIHTGSEADCARVRQMSLDKGEEQPLAIPGHTIHFDLPEDQGRMVDQTFYIANPGEEVSSLAKKELREHSLPYIRSSSQQYFHHPKTATTNGRLHHRLPFPILFIHIHGCCSHQQIEYFC